jgi:hypothetical protein
MHSTHKLKGQAKLSGCSPAGTVQTQRSSINQIVRRASDPSIQELGAQISAHNLLLFCSLFLQAQKFIDLTS